MAIKKVFMIGDDTKLYYEKDISYIYYCGFAYTQRQKCVKSLHAAVTEQFPEKRILEVSTKSLEELGIKLSAFNLSAFMNETGKTVPVECIFQGSKRFELGGPYKDLYEATPKDAKRDKRIKESGELIAFEYQGKEWPLKPQTLFYDWLYINALYQHCELMEELDKYDVFTDIEFNHNKSINCQARSVAIFQTLKKRNLLDDVIHEKIPLSLLYSH